jgi:hypothetical protein
MSADPGIPGIPPPPEPPARPAPQEVLAAGFTHGDQMPGARGFAAGGPLDVMEPGPALAGVTADAAAGGLAVLDDDQLVGVLCAAQRLESWASSIRLRAVADLTARRDAAAAATGDRRQAEHVGDEVAAALTLTCRAADRLVSLAVGVTRLPAAAIALAAGRIDLPRAAVFADELAGLDDVAAAAIAAVVGGDAAGLTTSRLRDRLHREVLAFDPQAARKRREKAEKDARVECWAEPSGTWSMAGRDMPPAGVLAADKHLDADARALKAAGAPGTLEQLRAAVFLARLNGQPLATLLPAPHPGNERPDNEHPGGPGQDLSAGQDGNPAGEHCGTNDDGPGAHSAGGDPNGGNGPGDVDGPGDRNGPDDGDGPGPGGGPRRLGPCPGPGAGAGTGWPPVAGPGSGTGLTGTISLTVPLATWLGLTGQPGEATGYGHLDAAASRDLAAAIAAGPGTRWHLIITGPDGTAIGHGRARKGNPPPNDPPPPGGTGPPSDPAPPGGTGPPGSPAPPGGTGPPGSPAPPGGTGPPGSPAPPGGTGQSGGMPPPSGPALPGLTGDAGQLRWLAGIKISWLETGACGHPRETFAYQPSATLRNLIKIRNATCTFPGCRRTARRCDDDHTVPYHQGGRTCECNLSPLCRRHHGAKQAPGWHLQQPTPGTLTWTLPSGRTHTVTPRSYPV